jgi:hypothetical protein
MGLWTRLEIYQVDDLQIKDLPDLNTKLMDKTEIGELYHDECQHQSDWQGPLKQGANGELQIYYRSDGGCEGYDQETEIWGCYGSKLFQAIADAMVGGKLVFRINCEEPSYNSYYILTPGNVKEVSEVSMKPTF